MPNYFIEDINDPRLDPYRDLRVRNPTRWSNYFIAEGRLVAERLLNSRHRTLSLLVEAGREGSIKGNLHCETEILSVRSDLLEQLVGFDFHRGVMACGLRPLMVPTLEFAHQFSKEAVIVAVHEVQDPTNLGSIIRTAVALGVTHMILGKSNADPFSRRVMRVSMGTALELEFLESTDLGSDLLELWRSHKIRSVAATLEKSAEELSKAKLARPLIAVFGNEGAGLPQKIQSSCTNLVTIPMSEVADSLNVSVAAGIFLYELTKDRSRSSESGD